MSVPVVCRTKQRLGTNGGTCAPATYPNLLMPQSASYKPPRLTLTAISGRILNPPRPPTVTITHKSIKLPASHQRLVDDIIALHSYQPTIEKCQALFSLTASTATSLSATNRYKMAGQWFAFPNTSLVLDLNSETLNEVPVIPDELVRWFQTVVMTEGNTLSRIQE